MIGRAKIGQAIARIRRSQSITQEQLAMAIGSNQPHLSDIETGNKEPTVEMLYRICDELNISILELFQEVEKRR